MEKCLIPILWSVWPLYTPPPPPSAPTGAEHGNLASNHPFLNDPGFSLQHVHCVSDEGLPLPPSSPAKGKAATKSDDIPKAFCSR